MSLRSSGQPNTEKAPFTRTVRHVFPDYDKEISYYGKRQEFFIVRILLKNGTLFRSDSYTLLPKAYPNGFLRDSLSRVINHGTTKIMYPSGKLYVSCEYKEGELHGPFMAFYEDGAIKRREYFKHGRITESHCYTPEGTLQKCEPFYQNSAFLGKPKDLQKYMRQKLDSLLDGEHVWRITASLMINEIGQVVRVGVQVDAQRNIEIQPIGNYVQQIIRNMPEWVPDKLNWKPALNDGTPVSSICTLSLFRYHGFVECMVSYKM